jgi:hypothetical protein
MSRVLDLRGLRFELAYRKLRGETLTERQQHALDLLNARLDASLPPLPGLPEDALAAMEEARELLDARKKDK